MAIRQLAVSRFKYQEARAVLGLMGVKLREVRFGAKHEDPEITVGIEHEALAESTELMGLIFHPESGNGAITFRAVLIDLSIIIETAQVGAVAAHQTTPAPIA